MSKVDIRIPQIARMRVAGHKDAIIAQAVGLTPMGLARILALPVYKDVEQAVLHGVVSKMDAALAGRADALRNEFKVGVPLAMRTLLEAVQQRRDLRASLDAAKEILDRDPDRVFAKGGAKPGDNIPTLDAGTLQAITGNADSVSHSLASAPSQAPAAPVPSTESGKPN